jgi:hypothetical protein
MLVQADRQHPRVVIKRRLHPVTVVHVDVDVGDPFGTRPVRDTSRADRISR